MTEKPPKGNYGVRRLRREVRTSGTVGLSCGNKPVTGLLEGTYTIGDLAFEIDTEKRAKKNRRKIRSDEIKEYFSTTFEFQLWRGDTAFGRPKSMTGEEAWKLNREYELKFLNDKSPNSRLWRWHKVGSKPRAKMK